MKIILQKITVKRSILESIIDLILGRSKYIFIPANEESAINIEKLLDATYQVDIKNFNMRTLQQNRALHLWATQIANVLNENQLYMIGVFGNEIEWTMNLVKEQIIKSTIKQVYNIDSTTKLTRKEVDGMIDFVIGAFVKKNVEIPPFPNRELWENKKGEN